MVKQLEPKVLKKNEGELLKVLADNITIKVDGDDTGGLFTVVEINHDTYASVPPLPRK